MSAVRVCLVGCGRMGRCHLAAAAGLAEVEIVAVVDPMLASGSLAGVDRPIVLLEDVLKGAAVEALIVAAPTPVHEILVRSGLERGKHVLSEKPLTLDPEVDLELGNLATEQGRVLQVGFWRRFAEPFMRLRQVIAGGDLGVVRAIRAAQWDARLPPLAFCDASVSGGLEIDCGVHEFDIAHWLIGAEAEAVAACGTPLRSPLATVDDVATVQGLARLSGDRIMTIDLTRTAGYCDSIRTELIGDHGSAAVDFDTTGTIVVRSDERRQEASLATSDVIADALKAQLVAFSHAVRTGRLHPDASTATDSQRALLAASALRDARLTGTWRRVGETAAVRALD